MEKYTTQKLIKAQVELPEETNFNTKHMSTDKRPLMVPTV